MAVPAAIRLLAALSFDVVLLETVGVGQSEIEISAVADPAVVILNPGAGDAVQAAKAGLLAATVEHSDVELLWKKIEERPGLELTVDLEACTVTADDLIVRFSIDDYTRWRLMEGLDDIGLTLSHEAEVAAFERSRPAYLPVTT